MIERIDWRAVVDEAIDRRKREGLSQRALAALAGVSTPTVNAFEQGEINLRFEKVVAILEALDLFVQSGRPDGLGAFAHAARRRWEELASELPEDHPSRFPKGRSEQSYSIDGTPPSLPLSKLRELLLQAPRTSGWPPFWVPTKPSIAPTIKEGLIECWLGQPKGDRLFVDPSHSDFWQVARNGRAYLARGYQEDGADFEPGAIFDLTLPIWRTAEVLKHAAWLARQISTDPDPGIRFQARYSGLSGRELLSWAKPLLRYSLDGTLRARTDATELNLSTTAGEIDRDLPALVSRILAPLYERFEGYQVPQALIDSQIDELERHAARDRR